MAVAAGVEAVPLMAASIATFEVPTQRRCAAHLDGGHHAPLLSGHRRAMLIAIGLAVAAEYIRHFQPGTVHRLAAQKCCGGAGGGSTGTGRGSRSSGLEVEHTLLVAIRRYRAVVARLRWPSRSWIVRTSVPDSSR